MVERNLAKVEVAGSSLVFRSRNSIGSAGGIFYLGYLWWWGGVMVRLDSEVARVAELVDAQDLKSCFPQRKYGFDSRPGHRWEISQFYNRLLKNEESFFFQNQLVMSERAL